MDRTKLYILKLSALAAAFFMACSSAYGDIFQWRDAEGKVHFGDRPPEKAVSERITRLENRPDIKNVSFLIGGSDGHSSELRNCCDEIWSLSAMTMQHELALVVLLEQLYRAYTIKRGEPYHRA